MAGITLQQAETNLAKWVEASEKVAESQSYTIQVDGSSRSLTRANAAWIQKQIEFWDKKVRQLSLPANKRRRNVHIVG
ncbi:DUF6148 family protein [Maritalea sp.]|jgi:hypothetical protein|uniref:DUF6148 family protein n=1 Tax=Maritalea sp. TaxID=2003361 RepID=UPI0039E2A1DF